MMNYAQLKFPTYEWIKALPLKEDGRHLEYSFTLFRTPTSVYGRFSYNEDDSGWVFFDIMEDGFCDHHERLNKRLKFNKENYKLICDHAQKVYEEFQRELFADQSWRWSKPPEEYEEPLDD